MHELISAVQRGRLSEVQKIVEADDFISQDLLKESFHIACQQGHHLIVDYFLNLKNKHNQLGALYGGISWVYNRLRGATHRIEFHAPRRIYYFKHDEQEYFVDPQKWLADALLVSSAHGHLDVVNQLITANLKFKPNDYQRAFEEACSSGALNVVLELLSHDVTKGCIVDVEVGFSRACRNGHLEVVNALLEMNRFTVNHRARNEVALFWACAHGRTHVVNRLLQLPYINPRVSNYEALRSALNNGYLEVVQSVVTWANAHGHRADVEAIIREANRPDLEINWGQSIHAGSVHSGASESALRLKVRYGQTVEAQGLDEVLGKLISLVGALDTNTTSPALNFIRRAAQRYINEGTLLYRVNPKLDFDYVDNSHALKSNVSTKELLAYLYLASQDEGLENEDGSTTSKQEKEEHLVQGFYEAVRGYNIDENDVDNLAPEDATICVQGCFNKAVESMAGRHPDCKIALVTHRQAGLKFPKIVQEEAIRFLLEDAPESKIRLSNVINSKDIIPIWPYIESKVIDRVMEEFGTVYSGDPQNVAFQSLLAVHADIPIAPIVAAVELRSFVNEALKSHLNAHPEDLERFMREGVDKDKGLSTLWSAIENEFFTKFKPKMMKDHGDYFGLDKYKKAELDRIIQTAKAIVFTMQEMELLTNGLLGASRAPLLMSRDPSEQTSSAARRRLRNETTLSEPSATSKKSKKIV